MIELELLNITNLDTYASKQRTTKPKNRPASEKRIAVFNTDLPSLQAAIDRKKKANFE